MEQNYNASGLTPIEPQTDTSPLVIVENNVKQLLTQVPGINYVDEDWGQLDYYSQNPPVKWPCALIDVSNAAYNNMVRNPAHIPQLRQEAKCMLTVRLADIKLTNSSTLTPVTQQTAASNIKELAQLIHNTLHGINIIQQATMLLRHSMQRQMRDDGIQEYVIAYTFDLNNV